MIGATGRIYPNVRVHSWSPNKYDRAPAYDLIVVHATEGTNLAGIADLRILGDDVFGKRSTEASTQVGVDADGLSGRFVHDYHTAWACSHFNGHSLNIEHIGKTAQRAWDPDELREGARWGAYWSLRHGIPLHKGRVHGENVTRKGVVRHSELGVAGGNHDDPGDGFPLSTWLTLARAYRSRMIEYERRAGHRVIR